MKAADQMARWGGGQSCPVSTGNRQSHAYNRGFTLIELLITLAVAVIISTIAVPGFQTVVASSRLAADHNEIIAALTSARSEAVKRREEVTFDMAAEESGTWRYRIAAEGPTVEPLMDRVLENASFDVGSFHVTFDALGQRAACSSEPCQFRVEHGDKKTVFISLAGYIGEAQAEDPVTGSGS